MLLPFLRLFLPGLAVILTGFGSYVHIEQQHVRGELRLIQRQTVQLASRSLLMDLQNVLGDLRILAEHRGLAAAIEQPRRENLEALTEDFRALLLARPVYHKVRWIDETGLERVRVDLRDGQPVRIPAGELESKAERYYFRDTAGGPPGTLYLSPLDLNIEDGRVEVPYRPMLRLATPLVDRQGRRRGILVLNYLAGNLLEHFAANNVKAPYRLELLNGAGYWLHAVNPEDSWGFMFQRQEKTLEQRDPATWQAMQGGDGEHLEMASGLWFYERLRLSAEDLPGVRPMLSRSRQDDQPARHFDWIITSHLPPAELAANHPLHSPRVLGLAAFLILLCALICLTVIRQRQRELASTRRFQAVFDNAMVGIGILSPERRWLGANPNFCRMLGYSEAELRQRTWVDITHPDDIVGSERHFTATLDGRQEGYFFEKRYLHRDGHTVDASISARAVRDRRGQAEFLVAVIDDITDRKRTARELAFQMQRSDILLELPARSEQMKEADFMQYGLGLTEQLTGSQIGFIHFVDEETESIELVTWSKNTLAGYCQVVHATHYPIPQAGIWADAARRREPVTVNDYARAEGKHGLPDGHAPLHRLISVPVLETGKVRMLLGVGNKETEYHERDVETVQLIGNEIWRLVQRMRNRHQLEITNQVVSASPVVSFRWAPVTGWPVTFVTENVQQWGYTAAGLLAGEPPFADIVHPDDLARVGREVSELTAQGALEYTQEYRLVTRDNRVIWVVDRTRVCRDENGAVLYYDGVLTDISERKAQELALQTALDQQQKLNKRLEQANNQLLQSEKMASIGQLAAGIAHELNNPIGFVHSNLGTLDSYLNDLMTVLDAYQRLPLGEADELALRTLKKDIDFDYLREDIFKLVSESKEGVSRVKKIVQDLRNFSRVGEQEWQLADLHEGLDSTLNIVWNELKYKCKVIKDYGDIPPIHCLISQLNQVFMNLLVNAGHAIEKQGEITVRTRRFDDLHVVVEVSDTGSGIPRENLHRIFEPFFTTKPVGKGTGLGLSLAYSIVARHHGRIEVDSEVGRGTTFRLILPIQPPADAPATAA